MLCFLAVLLAGRTKEKVFDWGQNFMTDILVQKMKYILFSKRSVVLKRLQNQIKLAFFLRINCFSSHAFVCKDDSCCCFSLCHKDARYSFCILESIIIIMLKYVCVYVKHAADILLNYNEQNQVSHDIKHEKISFSTHWSLRQLTP